MKVFDFSRPKPPWVVFTSGAEASRLNLVTEFVGGIRYIDGTKLSGKASSLKEVAAALNFPSYFGYNWDALDECLGDVGTWLRRDAVLVVADRADSLMTSEHLLMLVDVLCSGSERAGATCDDDGIALDREPTALHFVFLVEERNMKELERRLRRIDRSRVYSGTYLAIS